MNKRRTHDPPSITVHQEVRPLSGAARTINESP